jgi:glycosyltransferase involved in cell wall biosynthesis
MKSLIGIITYRRLKVLQETLKGITQHCSQYDLVIAEDCGQSDGTETFLTTGRQNTGRRMDLLADTWVNGRTTALLGTDNLGVSGNSNRILKLFEEGGYDHLCLLNDDLHVLGDFVAAYRKAHDDLGVGMFCFCDFTHDESYRWITVNSRGYRVKLCPRMTGIMMSVTAEVVKKIGYFDVRFGQFGQEHCDYTNRARFSDLISLDGQMQTQIDIDFKPPVLRHQECQTSVTGLERQIADQDANRLIQEIGGRYGLDPCYRPFYLRLPGVASGRAGFGIPVNNLGHYHLIDAPV